MERTVGDCHPDVAKVLNELGAILASLGRYAEAEEVCRRSVGIMAGTAGIKAEVVQGRVRSWNQLATVFRLQGRHLEAEAGFRLAIHRAETWLGPRDPEVAITLQHLAGLYEESGRTTEAERLHQRALDIVAGIGVASGSSSKPCQSIPHDP